MPRCWRGDFAEKPVAIPCQNGDGVDCQSSYHAFLKHFCDLGDVVPVGFDCRIVIPCRILRGWLSLGGVSGLCKFVVFRERVEGCH